MRQFSDLEDSTLLLAQLGRRHRSRVLRHFRALPARDLWLRFGYAISDEALERYVRSIHFARDAMFGIFDESAELLAVGHVGFPRDGTTRTAEFGVSVLPQVRRRGFGLRLLHRAAVHARNRGARRLVMNYVPENEALKSLAQRAGMQLVPDVDEPRAYLELELPTAASLMDETFSEMLAAIDLGFRVANESAERAVTSA